MVCGKPLDSGAWHAQDCARIPINERHNALGLDVRNMAREASLRANNEQRAVELPLDEQEEEGESLGDPCPICCSHYADAELTIVLPCHRSHLFHV